MEEKEKTYFRQIRGLVSHVLLYMFLLFVDKQNTEDHVGNHKCRLCFQSRRKL